ncbi:winged helix-turn-helix transcriptional regulator [bacterium]|nr:winged helix-turn-helix transcriptional regulator [bacterium]
MKKSAVIAGLAALAQDTRLDIFRLLVEAGPEGIAAGEIGRRLGLPSPTLSFHLSQLRFAGLVASRRQSRSIIYRANFAAMAGLVDYLTHNCCGGKAELCAPAGCVPAVEAPRRRATKSR